jgi:hypothetical protein
MKKIILPIILLVFLAACAGETTTTTIEQEKLNGKVKIIKETDYSAVEKFGEITKGEVGSSTTKVCDEKGNMIEENEYRSDGSLSFKYIYKYDEKGNNMEMSTYIYDSLHCKYLCKYDEKGNLIEANDYNSDGNLRCKYIYKI